jgi:hypothetical protein
LPAVWPQPITTDAEGRFSLTCIPRDHGAGLSVKESELFAPQDLMINTGLPEKRGERDSTYRAQVVNGSKPDEEVALVLAPAQWFTGTVRYADTGEPAPHARLTISASQYERGGSMSPVGGRAD